jgi:hypothetical protein
MNRARSRRLFRSANPRGLLIGGVLVLAITVPAAMQGAALKGAHVSEVIQDVKLFAPQTAPRRAAVNDPVNQGMAVRTGIQSRAELTFSDLTITRLGENTVFTYGKGPRQLDLAQGSVLVEVPPKGAPAHINTAAVSAAVTGGTAMFATGPPAKFMVLEGTGTFYPAGHPEEAVTLHGGEMLMLMLTGHLTKPLTFNVKAVMKTSHLIKDFPKLANLPLISDVMEEQTSSMLPAPSPGPQKDIVDQTSQAMSALPTPTPTPSATPSATPSKVGPPQTIASPAPYLITSGTTITTDPAITTNGVTNYGTIYRGPAIDGPLSAWAFGSTSSFDTTSGFDSHITTSGAGFKFQALELTGDPTIDTTNGETSLGLIAVDSITSGSPGGALTFTGISGLLLATQNGPVTLGSEISFSGLDDLTLYARGGSSDLTLGANVNINNHLRLYAEHDVATTSAITAGNVSAVTGRDFNANGGSVNSEMFTVTAGRDVNIDSSVSINAPTVSISAVNNVNLGDVFFADIPAIASADNVQINSGGAFNAGSLLVDRFNDNGSASGQDVTIMAGTDFNIAGDVQIQADGNVSIGSGSAMTIGGDFVFRTFGSYGVMRAGDVADITVMSGGDLIDTSTSGPFPSVASFIQNQGGVIQSGGNVLFNVAGNLTAPTLGASLNNQGGGFIGNGGNVTVEVGGALNTIGETLFGLFNGGGQIQSGGNVLLATTGDVSGGLIALTFDNSHGVIGDGGNVTFNVGGTETGPVTVTYNNFSGGQIGTGGNILVETGQNLSAGSSGISLTLQNTTGSIGNGGDITLNVGGSLSTQNLYLFLQNYDFSMNAAGSIGTGGNLSVMVGGNLSASSIDANINNGSGGMIGSDTSINVSALKISTAGSFDAEIDNSNGGAIGGNAQVQIGATGNVTANSLTTLINNNGGSIGGDATINMNVGGTATVTNDATAQILGNDPAGSAAINFNGGSYSVGGTFLSTIDGNGAITFNNATLNADIVKIGVFGTNGTLIVGGGSLSADSELKLYAPGSNGFIHFVSNVTVSSASTAAIIAANTVTIDNGVTVTIGGPAALVFTNTPNYAALDAQGNPEGGNGSTTGRFGGAGASTSPLSEAPPFSSSPGSPSVGTATTNTAGPTVASANMASSSTGDVGSGEKNFASSMPAATSNPRGGKNSGLVASAGKVANPTIEINDSGQLLSLLDAAVPGADGKVAITVSKNTSHSRNSVRSNTHGRLRANRVGGNGRRMRDHQINNLISGAGRTKNPQAFIRSPSSMR